MAALKRGLLSFLSRRSGSGYSRRKVWRLLIAFLLLLFFGVSGSFWLSGRVVAVSDGDSVTIFTGTEKQKIRLYGIDCPELRQKGGAQATDFTRSLVLFETVSLSVRSTDSYGRSVAIVTLPDGRVLNEELLKSGHAWVYGRYCATPECEEWRRMQKQARKNSLGLWQEENPVPPWTWRRNNPRNKK